MGFNIAGLVIAKNYDKNISQLEDDINWDIEIIEEINFEEASSNWTPDDEFRLFFTDKATLIFFPHEWAGNRYSAHEASSLCYAYSATAMAFFISYNNVEEGISRFLITTEGEVNLAEGDKLAYEEEGLSADAIIFKLIDDLIGENYYEIDMAAKAYRCKKLNPGTRRLKSIQQEEERKKSMASMQTNQSTRSKVQKQATNKRWWEFWK